MLSKVKPLGLWGEKYTDTVLDRSLHSVQKFLEDLVLSEMTPLESKEKAFKVLFSLGLLRGSLPNLLCVVNLLRTCNLNMNYQREMNILLSEKPQTKFNFLKEDRQYFEVFFLPQNKGKDTLKKKDSV